MKTVAHTTTGGSGAARPVGDVAVLAYQREFARRVGIMEELTAETEALGLYSEDAEQSGKTA